jgi:hypothetical protein
MTSKFTIDKLKSLICTASDLNEPLNYLFDMLDANLLPSTMVADVESKEVTTLLKIAVETINKSLSLKTPITSPLLQQTIDQQIVHGICGLSGGLKPLTLIYLGEFKTAIICLYHKNHTELWRLVLSNKPFVKH